MSKTFEIKQIARQLVAIQTRDLFYQYAERLTSDEVSALVAADTEVQKAMDKREELQRMTLRRLQEL